MTKLLIWNVSDSRRICVSKPLWQKFFSLGLILITSKANLPNIHFQGLFSQRKESSLVFHEENLREIQHYILIFKKNKIKEIKSINQIHLKAK